MGIILNERELKEWKPGRLTTHLLKDEGWVEHGGKTNAPVVGERGQSTGSRSSYRIFFSNRESDCGWMASLEGQVEWKTGESKWIGESDTGNTVTFPVEIGF